MSETATIKNLALALLKSQQEIEGVSKDNTNPHFGSKFADLTAVIEAVVPTLNKNGIVVVQAPVPAPYEGYLALSTTLIHAESGETLSGTAVVPLLKNDPQAYGSALTYARRYSLGSFVGLKFKDDDAEGAVGRAADARRPVPAKPSPIPSSVKPSGIPGKAAPVKAAPVKAAPVKPSGIPGIIKHWPKTPPQPIGPGKSAPPRGKTSLFPKVGAKVAPIEENNEPEDRIKDDNDIPY